MVKRITVKSVEEFEEMLQKQDIKISKAISEVALKNLNNKKRFIPILEVYLEEEGDIFDDEILDSFIDLLVLPPMNWKNSFMSNFPFLF